MTYRARADAQCRVPKTEAATKSPKRPSISTIVNAEQGAVSKKDLLAIAAAPKPLMLTCVSSVSSAITYKTTEDDFYPTSSGRQDE